MNLSNVSEISAISRLDAYLDEHEIFLSGGTAMFPPPPPPPPILHHSKSITLQDLESFEEKMMAAHHLRMRKLKQLQAKLKSEYAVTDTRTPKIEKCTLDPANNAEIKNQRKQRTGFNTDASLISAQIFPKDRQLKSKVDESINNTTIASCNQSEDNATYVNSLLGLADNKENV